MVTDANSDGNVWAVREACESLFELVDSVQQVRLTVSREELRADAQKTVLMMTAAIIMADGKYDASEQVFIQNLVNLSDMPRGELRFLNEYASLWSIKSKDIPCFFQAAIILNSNIARSMLCEIQRIGNYVSICDGALRPSKRKIVAQYVEFLENSIMEHEAELIRLASNSRSPEGSVEESIIGKKSPPAPMITRQYFDLLKIFSNELLDVSIALENDDSLRQLVDNNVDKSKVESGTFIRNCVLFDLAKIFRILLDDDADARLAKMSGLAYAGRYVKGALDVISPMDYNSFIALHIKGSWIASAESMMDMASSPPPISINVSRGDNAPGGKSSDFALPAVLSYSGNPLFDKYAVTLCQFATVIAKADGVVSGNEEVLLKQIYEMVHNPIPEIAKNTAKVSKSPDNQSLKEVLDELDLLVGLVSVKQEVMTLINFSSIQKKREELGLKSSQVSYHLVLTGSPGTGKTTVARIVSKIYNKLGILEKGQLVETDRSGLIAEYTGQTPGKVNRAVDSALDGVLFIDEAYALVEGSNENYGKEALATLIKRMEDDRGRLVVMVAGYTEEMKIFINANSGLRSRFNKYIEFPDYVPEEMLEIFERQCKGLDYSLTDEARTKALNLFKVAYEQRDRSFGNGRYVRNMFEKSMELQANRVSSLSSLTKDILTTIVVTDIPE